ncbi:RNA polymerase factor sigma-54 [Rhodobacteraceae bacterium NNCM2]|nr:RNA polymerase factor sigma-54 [Coraliihabitans acroporae]
MRLELTQSQQLVMTPQLQQAIKLLQMSNIELCDFVAEELERNPLLELAPESGAERPDQVNGAKTDEVTSTDQRVTAEGDHSLGADTFDTGRENLHDDGPTDAPQLEQADGWSTVGSGGSLSFDGNAPDFDDNLHEEQSLREHLLGQLGQTRLPLIQRQLACQIVEELDEHGYFRGDLLEFADRMGADPISTRLAFEAVQACEPTGVGARSLQECFALQLAERNRLDPAMQTLLDNLDLLPQTRPAALAARCGVDEEDFREMLAELRTLSPRPASTFSREQAETLIPDVFLRRASWGGWQVELNTDTLPRVLVNNRYASEVERQDAEAREFISNCRNTANWLVKSLDQRARTILRVATEIVRQQDSFFDQGISGLRPLNLKTVADALDIHESTASRVTSNKYIATERGIFELKFFFTNAVGPDDTVSAEVVRHRVKTLVNAEDPANILSDDAIVDILQRDGIDIARRTVAKYRKVLRIPSSVERRRQKAHCLS